MKKKDKIDQEQGLLTSLTKVEPSTKRDPWGCMAGTIFIQENVDLTAPTGEVWNADTDQASQRP